MPAKSEKQREAIAIAEHNPSKLYKRNKGLLKMSKSDQHDFASTKGLKKTESDDKKFVKAMKGRH